MISSFSTAVNFFYILLHIQKEIWHIQMPNLFFVLILLTFYSSGCNTFDNMLLTSQIEDNYRNYSKDQRCHNSTHIYTSITSLSYTGSQLRLSYTYSDPVPGMEAGSRSRSTSSPGFLRKCMSASWSEVQQRKRFEVVYIRRSLLLLQFPVEWILQIRRTWILQDLHQIRGKWWWFPKVYEALYGQLPAIR